MSFWLDDEGKPSPGIPATKETNMPADTARSPSGTYHLVEPMTQDDIDRAIGKRFRDLFGNGTTPEEIQRRLERAQDLRLQAEQQCENLRVRRQNEDPLALAVFVDCHRRATGGTPTARANARRILAALDAAGGIRGKEEA
jgi:hypothetical protein